MMELENHLVNIIVIIFYFLTYFIDYVITVVPFPPLYSPPPCTPLPTCSITHLLCFISMGHTYKFFGFYISYTILNLPLSTFYLPCMLLIPCTFFPILPTFPADNSLCDLNFCDSVPFNTVFTYFRLSLHYS